MELRIKRAVADAGISKGGCANSQNCYYFSKFCQKLHENERIWTPGRGARVPGAPLGSANGVFELTVSDLYVDPPLSLHLMRSYSTREKNHQFKTETVPKAWYGMI